MSANAFGQSRDASNGGQPDLGTTLAGLAANIGGAIAAKSIAGSTKKTVKAVTPSGTTIALIAGGAAILLIGGVVIVALLVRRK